MALSEIRFGFRPIHGELLSVPRLMDRVSPAEATRAVLEAAHVAVARGTRVIGLGALTGPATGGGLKLLPTLPGGVTVTNGNAYTAAVVRHNVIEAARLLDGSVAPTVAVIGCTGSVGQAASHLLSRCGFPIILIGSRLARTRRLFRSGLRGPHRFGDGVQAAYGADILVLLTNHPDARLDPPSVRPGSIVIDCAQPQNLSDQVVRRLAERGVEAATGGLVDIPGFQCEFDFELGPSTVTFACLAETYLFGLEGLQSHSVGRPGYRLAEHLDGIAAKQGITVQPLKPLGRARGPVRDAV